MYWSNDVYLSKHKIYAFCNILYFDATVRINMNLRYCICYYKFQYYKHCYTYTLHILR